MIRPRSILVSIFSLVLFALQGCDSSHRAGALRDIAAESSGGEIVVYTAREIITLDANRPAVEAIAVEGDRILATGPLDEIVRGLAGRTFRVDRQFDRAVLIPGLINQHEHTWLAAIAMIAEIISIEDWELPDRTMPRATDAEDYRRRLKAAVARHQEAHGGTDEVLYTWGYHQLFHGDLSRGDLDQMSRSIPIVVFQRSMHELIFNSRALELFDIDQATIDRLPEAARAQTDLARGHFWEQGSMAVIPAFFPDLFAPQRYLPALERARDYWHAAGSTLVAEPGGLVSPALMAMQNKVLGDPDTPLRMHYIADGKSMVAAHPADEVIAATDALAESATGFTRFLPKQVKLFADGAMFSQLMQMRDGYLDGHQGEWLMEPEVFELAFQIYWDAGYQIHVHQNGDAGLDLVLDTLEMNMKRNPRSDHRTVIVHFGFSRSDQISRIAELGAIVSANPFYTTVLADRYSEVGIGPERAQEMVRLGEAVRAGISVSLHADMPMAPGKPLLLMGSAVNRKTVNGNIAAPNQRLTPLQALRAVTINAAYSLQLEKEVGSIEPGKLANLTVLAENPLTVSPETIQDIRVEGTVHEGRVLLIQPEIADADIRPEKVDPAIYARVDDPTDPYRHKYAEFRERRLRDQADPNSPEPIERYAARHRTNQMPWGDPEILFPFDWASIRAEAPSEVDQLLSSLRIRLAFDHPDLEIRQMVLGAGALLPMHSDGAPGAFVVISGGGQISVEAETWNVTRGTTVKLEPYVGRRVLAGDEAPLHLLWIRWAPGGNQAYIDSGYYLTGANQHIQPAQADFGDAYPFWGDVSTSHGMGVQLRPLTSTEPGSIYARQESAQRAARAALPENGQLYPSVPVFGHADGIEWLSEETLRSGGFFFSEDVPTLGGVVDRMIQIARHKAIFRAIRPDGRWDFNFSQSAWGPRSTYVEHSHVIPEFYYVLSGPVTYGVDGDLYRSEPGDILFNNSYSPHLAQGIIDGLVFRSFSSTFAPNGDRSVFDRPGFLVERLPTQPASARLAEDISFH